MKTLFLFYIASVIFLHAPIPVPMLTVCLCIAIVALVYLIAAGDLKEIRIRTGDKWFGIIYVLGLAPFFFMLSDPGVQNLKYIMAWPLAWFFFYWWIREWGIYSQVRFLHVSKAAAIGCGLLSVAVVFEFFTANCYGFFISDLLAYSTDNIPDANAMGETLVRPRGFSSEAGFTAICMECLFPLSIFYIQSKACSKYLYFLICGSAYILLFSGGSIICLLATMAVFFFVFRKSFSSSYATAAIILISSIVAICMQIQSTRNFFHETVGRKLLEFSSPTYFQNKTSFSRPEAYQMGVQIITEHPLGVGWGGVSQMCFNGDSVYGVFVKGSGLISIPIEIAASAGYAGAVIYLIIFFFKLWQIKINALGNCQYRKCIFFSLCWVGFHHMVVLEFWFPMLWLSLALCDMYKDNSANTQSRSIIEREVKP